MLQTFGKDKYGRTLADVFLSDGINLCYDSLVPPCGNHSELMRVTVEQELLRI
jgi:hypothetical protein